MGLFGKSVDRKVQELQEQMRQDAQQKQERHERGLVAHYQAEALEAERRWKAEQETPEGQERTRRTRQFETDFNLWIDGLRAARAQTGATVLTQETLDLAGERPVIDARGMDQASAALQARGVKEHYTGKVREEIAVQATQAGDPAGFWNNVSQYIYKTGFEVLNDSLA